MRGDPNGENLHYMVKASRLRRLATRRAASGPGVRLSGRSRPAPPAIRVPRFSRSLC
ncbi:hypothetical protein [Microbispora rosea]|uniref:hypothetical protein n=1 Tax=Microbispora rosea TaxID=58117 RepID=UPI000AE2D3B3|nr:hypothetical protein [Microbispora rosea]